MDDNFIDAAHRAFDPYTLGSGTENLGPLLYWLARVGRYETVAEFGTGFTTLFLAKALADNQREFTTHRRLLRERIERNREAVTRLLNLNEEEIHNNPAIQDIFVSTMEPVVFLGGPPVAPNPFFYEQPYNPQLFSWEHQPEIHNYVLTLRNTLRELKLDQFVTVRSGAKIEGYLNEVPAARRPIGMAWNDFGNKTKFFRETFEHITPDGGILVFHSPSDFQDEITQIKSELKDQLLNGTCEYLTLVEPHKFLQTGCFLIRRTGERFPNPKIAIKSALQAFLALKCDG
jgi:hypothetical protein